MDTKIKTERCVVKIGSALLTGNGKGLDINAIQGWVGQIAALRAAGHQLLLVTSGAVAVGMQRMNLDRRPHALYNQQALAAIGQMGLVQTYESAFQKHNLHTAQVLLTHDDMTNRKRYLNARSTLHAILQMGVLPVINENDTVATDEIRFGDNDTLAAMVANLVEADRLIILTDQQGLYDKDPRNHDDARLVTQAQAGDASLEKMAGDSGELGRGGMATKIRAAAKAARSGTTTFIVHGGTEDVIRRVFSGEQLGTRLDSPTGQLAARKRWLAGQTRLGGKLVLDEGAVKVLRESGRSLLPVGVTTVEGDFSRGELVACIDSSGTEVARGLVNYNADESRRIAGQASDQIESLLGYVDEPELIHRDNMVVI